MAIKTLWDNGVKDFVILEATNRIRPQGQSAQENIGRLNYRVGCQLVAWRWRKTHEFHVVSLLEIQASDLQINFNNISHNIYYTVGGILPESLVRGPCAPAKLSSHFSKDASKYFHSNGDGDIYILPSKDIAWYGELEHAILLTEIASLGMRGAILLVWVLKELSIVTVLKQLLKGA